MVFESLMPKVKKICLLFFMYLTFSSNLKITLKICLVLCNAIEKSLTKNEENLLMQVRFMQTFLTYAPRNLLDAQIPAGFEG